MLGKDSPTEKYPCLLFIYLFIVVISVYVRVIYTCPYAWMCMHGLSDVDTGCLPQLGYILFFLKTVSLTEPRTQGFSGWLSHEVQGSPDT